MDRKKINLIFSVSMICLGILNILLGLFDDRIPHSLRLGAAVAQLFIGCLVIVTSILKLKGKF